MTCIFALVTGMLREPSGTAGPMEFAAEITHENHWYVARLDVEVASQWGDGQGDPREPQRSPRTHFEDKVLPDGLEPPIIAILCLTA